MNNNNNNNTKKYFAIALAVFVIIMIGSAILSAVSALLGSFNFFGIKSFFYGGGNDFTVNESSYNFTEDFSGVQRIKIDSDVANIVVVYSDNSQDVNVKAVNATSRFSTKLENNKLSIEEKTHSKIFSSGNPIKITITIPMSTIIDFDIDCGVGDFNADELICNDFDISNGVGDVDIGKLTSYNAELNSGVGNLYIDSAVISNTEIDCGVGNIEINYDMPASDFRMQAESGITSIRINGEKFDKKIHSNPAGNSSINIDSGVGNIELSFLD